MALGSSRYDGTSTVTSGGVVSRKIVSRCPLGARTWLRRRSRWPRRVR